MLYPKSLIAFHLHHLQLLTFVICKFLGGKLVRTGFLPDNLVASRQNLGHGARHIQLQEKRPQSKKKLKIFGFH
jgi:hypothetical protein